LWIEHLAYCLAGSQGESRSYGRDNSEWCFAPVPSEQAKDYLNQLVEGYQRGRSVPLPLFCKSGWVWLSTCMNKETGEIDSSDEIQSKAESQLLKAWLGDQGRRGEGDDPYVQRAFRQADKSFLAKLKQEALSYLLPIARYQNT
jgi:exodeoxyribonuclease V gamma subunit